MSRRAALQALALVLALPSTGAFAQDSPSAGTSAVRYDLGRRETGAISPDPDGAGPLAFIATRNTWDAAGRLVRVEKGVLNSWQSESIAPANWTGFTVSSQVDTTYDAMGRKVREAVSGVTGGTIVTTGVTEYSYTLAGRPKCTAVRMNPDVWATPLADKCTPGTAHATHGSDRITRNTYTAHGEILKIEKAVGAPAVQIYASYAYSPNGKQVSVTDANGNKAELSYDGFDRQKRWIFPSKTVPGSVDGSDYEEYGYDANANRTSVRKRDGSILTYQYDALNRLAVKIVPERAGLASTHTRDVHYEYDNRGLQTQARFDSLAGEGITNVYDGFGGLTSSSSNMGGVARTVGNLYDLNGNRIRVIHPDNSFFTYEVDGLDRPKRIRENGGDPIVDFAYNSAGRRVSSGWAAVTSYGWDTVGRLQTVSHNLVGTSRDHDLGFTYNPASQIHSRSASNDAYAWGGTSNLVRPYAVNGLNQYTAAGTATFGHDANGNLSSTANAPHTTAYVYDIENRLVSASGSDTAALLYDPLGRLFQVTSGASVRRLVYDGDALVAEYEPGGYMVHRYIHGNDSGADDPLIWYDNWNGGWRRALLTDHQGSVIQVADMYGNPVATNTYDLWGIPGAAPVGRFGFTGQTWVPELGLWYYKARFYSPTLGRFLQVDPVGYEDQINLYAYVGNDPVNRYDPDGRQAQAPAAAAGCAVTGPACPVGAAVGVAVATGVSLCAASETCRGAVADVAEAVGNGLKGIFGSRGGSGEETESGTGSGTGARTGTSARSETRNEDSYFVRVQAQGTSLRHETSAPLSSNSPIKAGAVHGALAATAAALHSRDQAALAPAFAKAAAWVDRVAAGGGINPIGNKPFHVPGTSGTIMRVDIEVIRGPINIVR